MTETSDAGYWSYLVDGASHSEASFGTAPLSDGLEVWRRMSPTFNAERVNAPLLMWCSDVVGLADGLAA